VTRRAARVGNIFSKQRTIAATMIVTMHVTTDGGRQLKDMYVDRAVV
jgi:hypothetical protein